MKKYLMPAALLCLLVFPAAVAAQIDSAEKSDKSASQAQQDPFKKLFKEAMKLLGENEFAKAAQVFQRALKINPKSAEAHYRLGSCYYELTLYLEAIAEYREAIIITPDYYDAIVYLGNALDYDGQYASAVEMYKKAIRLKPEEWQPYYELGVAHYNQKLYGEAIRSFQDSLKYAEKIENVETRNNTISRANYYLGDAYRMSRRYAEAIKSYRETIRFDSKSDLGYFGLGMAYVGLGNANAARQQYDKLRELNEVLAAELLQEINKIALAA